MQLNKLRGNTYYINAPTNIGIYTFKSKNCLLVDTGIDNTQASKIDQIVRENNLHPRYIINTHSHTDHCGGNHYFLKNYPGCQIYASLIEGLFLEHPDLHSAILFSSHPPKGLGRTSRPVKADFILENGTNKIEEKRFTILPLGGHTPGQIGITTPDSVCFIGDSVFSEDIIGKYSFPNLFDVDQSIESLKQLQENTAELYVISHINTVLEKDELLALIATNLENIAMYREQILELLEQPLTREDLLENIFVLNDLVFDFKEYHLAFSSLSAFIKHLFNQQLIDYSLENGKLYYYKK
ncbi:MAG: MBL fold metallo-hydrolase [Syntrophomonadaceae bacterium]|jgi:glyoxylase-like metal-dependent hydrolase (beta-lactamase superfamily II)